MSNWKRIPTSAEVYMVLHARHGEALRVFSSYSNPTGNDGLSDTPQMMTEWGFHGDDFPICGSRATWERGEKEYERINQKHEYWLCVGELPDTD